VVLKGKYPSVQTGDIIHLPNRDIAVPAGGVPLREGEEERGGSQGQKHPEPS